MLCLVRVTPLVTVSAAERLTVAGVYAYTFSYSETRPELAAALDERDRVVWAQPVTFQVLPGKPTELQMSPDVVAAPLVAAPLVAAPLVAASVERRGTCTALVEHCALCGGCTRCTNRSIQIPDQL